MGFHDVSDMKLDFETYATKLKFHPTFGSHAIKFGYNYTYSHTHTVWGYNGHFKPFGFRNRFIQDLFGVFAEDSWQVFPRLNLTFGLRYDYYKNRIKGFYKRSDDLLQQRVSLRFDVLKNLCLYGSFGRISKSPEMADLTRWYGNYNLVSPTGRAILRNVFGISQSPFAPASIIPKEYIDRWRSILGRLKQSKGWDYEFGIRFLGEKFGGR